MYQPVLNENNVTKVAEICAWCDVDRVLTDDYRHNGYRTTHGICKKHCDEVLTEYIKDYEKNGFSIGNDDSSNNSNGV